MTEFPGRNFSLASVKRLLHKRYDRVCRPQVRLWSTSHCTLWHERDSCTAFSWDTRLHRSTVLATEQPGHQSGWLRGLGHFARASLPLPDPWRRPSERTTDCRMAPIWPEYHWQSCQPVAEATAGVCQREQRTLWASNLNVKLVCIIIKCKIVIGTSSNLSRAARSSSVVSSSCLNASDWSASDAEPLIGWSVSASITPADVIRSISATRSCCIKNSTINNCVNFQNFLTEFCVVIIIAKLVSTISPANFVYIGWDLATLSWTT